MHGISASAGDVPILPGMLPFDEEFLPGRSYDAVPESLQGANNDFGVHRTVLQSNFTDSESLAKAI